MKKKFQNFPRLKRDVILQNSYVIGKKLLKMIHSRISCGDFCIETDNSGGCQSNFPWKHSVSEDNETVLSEFCSKKHYVLSIVCTNQKIIHVQEQ